MTTVTTVWDMEIFYRGEGNSIRFLNLLSWAFQRFSWFGTEHFSSKPGSLDFLTLNNFCNTHKVLK